MVSEAAGNITVDPNKAVIKAKAKLNGASAEIDMVEPIGEGGPKRSRSIEMVLDDEAREELAPGIATLVRGPVSVKFTSGDGDSRRIEADLTDAKLDIPWVGWSKGPGIAATASFSLTAERQIHQAERTSNCAASRFADRRRHRARQRRPCPARGSIPCRLNRGDDASVTIDRKGKGFKINVTGKLARRPRDRQIAEGRARRGDGRDRRHGRYRSTPSSAG